MREEGDRGERALLLYTSRACADWHDKLVLHKAYNIATINEDLLAKIAHKLDSREVQANLEQVCILACVDLTKLIFSITFSTSLHPQTVIYQCHRCCCC